MSAGQRGVKSQPPVDVMETAEAQGLLETARTSGSLTTEEISLALDELDLDASQLDDFYTHRTERSFESDRRRDSKLDSLDWHVVRVTPRRLKAEPAELAAELRLTLSLR